MLSFYHFRFSDSRDIDDQVLRSPSRLGYSEDIPIIIEGQWENTSQDSNREDFNFLDLKGKTSLIYFLRKKNLLFLGISKKL